MGEISSDQAIRVARAEMGIDAATAARAWRVRWLNRPGDAYYLVVFGPGQGATAVAGVEAQDGTVAISARLLGREPHIKIDMAHALARAGVKQATQAELVWKPCRASHSPLYPLWEITSTAETVYVDQQGNLWHTLEPAGRGG